MPIEGGHQKLASFAGDARYVPTRMRWASAAVGGRWRMITPDIVLRPAGASQGEGEEAAPTKRPFRVFQNERLNHKPYICTVPMYIPMIRPALSSWTALPLLASDSRWRLRGGMDRDGDGGGFRKRWSPPLVLLTAKKGKAPAARLPPCALPTGVATAGAAAVAVGGVQRRPAGWRTTPPPPLHSVS